MAWQCGFPLSFFSAKPLSDALAEPVVDQLGDIYKAVRDKHEPQGHRQFILTVGHSLGGNLLGTALLPRYAKSLERPAPIKSLLGDLTLFINPASEAQKWVSLQRRVGEVFGFDLSGKDAFDGQKNRPRIIEANSILARQKPVLVSLTAACDTKGTDYNDKDLTCDTATRSIFPWHRYVTDPFNVLNHVTYGHLHPADLKGPEKLRSAARIGRERVGTTHEIDVTARGGERSTNLANARIPANSRCERVDQWLSKARERAPKKVRKGELADELGMWWDSENYKMTESSNEPKDQQVLTWVDRTDKRNIHVGIRHSIMEQAGQRLITSPGDPFWNMSARDGAIEGHNGYLSYPVWCFVNQLLLDEVM